MATGNVHPTAIIEDGAILAPGCLVAAYAVVKRGVRLGEGVRVAEHAVLGGDPQDLHFDPAVESYVEIGPGAVLREAVTVHRATRPGGATVVGAGAYLMAQSHVAHDCAVGAGAILANGVALGGFVTVGEGAFLGGGAMVHQHVRVGRGVMASGGSRVAHDVPPFAMTEDYSRAAGLNLVGLKRRGVSREVVAELRRAYRAVFIAAGSPAQNAWQSLEIDPADAAGFSTAEAREFLAFCAAESRRGLFKSIAKRTA